MSNHPDSSFDGDYLPKSKSMLINIIISCLFNFPQQ